uniref:Uncharacterized protein n=1 Tax=Rhizophora mucronata TaxID=61149 RepID=A0A2P2ITR6_RHIMU
MVGKEAVKVVDRKQCRHWPETIVCMNLEDPFDGVLAGGDVDGAVAATGKVIG